jgi:SAM-dependent methyltransferase
MIGRATSALQPAPRRWLQRWWGYPYLHARQDWHAVWPLLAGLPRQGLTILDAGCGPGRWTLELAARRPGWFLVGVDRSLDALRVAEHGRQRLRLSNVAFVRARFGELRLLSRFDVVLSVCSAHYLGSVGGGPDLFRWFSRSLTPGGRLILYGPRRSDEAPFVSWLPRFTWPPVFSEAELREHCRQGRLEVTLLEGRVRRQGTAAKQLYALADGKRRWVLAGLYPLAWLCDFADRLHPAVTREASLMWLLVARSGSEPVTEEARDKG